MDRDPKFLTFFRTEGRRVSYFHKCKIQQLFGQRKRRRRVALRRVVGQAAPKAPPFLGVFEAPAALFQGH